MGESRERLLVLPRVAMRGGKMGEGCEGLPGRTVGILAVAVFDGEVALGFDQQLDAVHVLELRCHVQRG